MAHGDGLLPASRASAAYLLSRTKLDPHLREIAIIRVGSFPARPRCTSTCASAATSACARRCSRRSTRGRGPHRDRAPGDGADRRHRRSMCAPPDATYDPLAARLSAQEMWWNSVTIGFTCWSAASWETFDVRDRAEPPSGPAMMSAEARLNPVSIPSLTGIPMSDDLSPGSTAPRRFCPTR